jgi:hypothetical protein
VFGSFPRVKNRVATRSVLLVIHQLMERMMRIEQIELWKYRAAALKVAARLAVEYRHTQRDLALRALKQLARLDDTIEEMLNSLQLGYFDDDEREALDLITARPPLDELVDEPTTPTTTEVAPVVAYEERMARQHAQAAE